MRAIVLTLSLFLLAACGQKGNLYLPDQPPPGRHIYGTKSSKPQTPALAPATHSAAAGESSAAPAETSASAPADNSQGSGTAAPAQP